MRNHRDTLGAFCRMLVESHAGIQAAALFDGDDCLACHPESMQLDAPEAGNLAVEGNFEIGAEAIEQAAALLVRQDKRVRYLESEVQALDRAEQELKRREIVLQGLVDGAPLPIFMIGRDGDVRFMNRFCESMLGLDREDVVGKSSSLSLFDIDSVQAEIVDRPDSMQRERNVEHAGETLTFLENLFPIIGIDGEVDAICVVAQDITLRKASEEALVESERNYREIFNRSTDLIILHSLTTGEVVDVNERLHSALGFDREEWIGQNNWMSSAVEMGDGVDISLNLVHEAADRPISLEWPLKHKDGSVRWFELHLSKTIITGQPYIMAVGRDIQQRKHEERRRILLEEDIRRSQKFDAMGRLAVGVAQEFNNLLSVILNYSDLIKRQTQDALLHEDVAQIQDAAARAAHLTRRLLLLGRRGVSSKPASLEVNDAVRNISELLQKSLGSGVQFELDLNPVSRIVMDPALFDQVMVNLTVHAREAMGSHGRFRIETSLVSGEDLPKFKGEEQVVRLRVLDSGATIPSESIDDVFDPFYSRTGAPLEASLGLGLAVVRSIVEHSGGYVTARSDEDGACFDVYLPTAEHSDVQVLPDEGARILVVEDEPGVLASVRRILETRGYAIATASNAEEALKVLDETPVDLLLTDVVMPGLSGPELAAKIRQTRPDLAILFMSGYPDNVIGPDLSQATATDLLLKPFSAKSLIRAIEGRLASAL